MHLIYLSHYGWHINATSGIEKEICNTSLTLNNKMIYEINNIPSLFVKDCVPILSKSVYILFDLVTLTSTFPSIWTSIRIWSVCKSVSNFAKVFDTVLYNYNYLSVK